MWAHHSCVNAPLGFAAALIAFYSVTSVCIVAFGTGDQVLFAGS